MRTFGSLRGRWDSTVVCFCCIVLKTVFSAVWTQRSWRITASRGDIKVPLLTVCKSKIYTFRLCTCRKQTLCCQGIKPTSLFAFCCFFLHLSQVASPVPTANTSGLNHLCVTEIKFLFSKKFSFIVQSAFSKDILVHFVWLEDPVTFKWSQNDCVVFNGSRDATFLLSFCFSWTGEVFTGDFLGFKCLSLNNLDSSDKIRLTTQEWTASQLLFQGLSHIYLIKTKTNIHINTQLFFSIFTVQNLSIWTA